MFSMELEQQKKKKICAFFYGSFKLKKNTSSLKKTVLYRDSFN